MCKKYDEKNEIIFSIVKGASDKITKVNGVLSLWIVLPYVGENDVCCLLTATTD
jgi:hypothetical protein